MLDQAAQAGDAAGLHIGQFPADGVLNHVESSPGEAPRRRITADSFRALSAKLKKQPFVPSAPAPEALEIPDIIADIRQAAAVPVAVEWTPAPSIETIVPEAEPFADEPVAEAEPPHVWPEVLAEPAIEEAQFEVVETVEPPLALDEEIAAPQQIEEVVEPAAPVEAVVETPAPAAETAALPQKLTLPELTKLVYSAPTEADRMLYMRELAEILAEETAKAQEALAQSSQHQMTVEERVIEEPAQEILEYQEQAEPAPAATWDHGFVEPVAQSAVADNAVPVLAEPIQPVAEPDQSFGEYEASPPVIEQASAEVEFPVQEEVFANAAEPTPVEVEIPEPAFEATTPEPAFEATTPEPVFEAEIVEPAAPPRDFSTALSQRLGGNAQLLRKAEESDPFAAQPPLSPVASAPQEELAAEEAEDVARSLLDMMSSTGGSGLPQERALAADTLLRMIPRMPLKPIVSVVERIAMMSQPPELLVARLIRDPRFEVAGPLLERCNGISDQDIAAVIQEGDFAKQRMIARRRVLSSPLADKLIAYNDTSVLLTLVRNAGASISHDAFYRLAEQAAEHASLLAPLSTRQDLPAPVAFELFWSVPPELRRYLLSRFLTDSETLNKILKITISMQGGEEQGEAKFPERARVDAVVELAIAGKLEEAAVLLAEIAAICPENAYRILADRDGEPLAIVMKALGAGRAQFGEIVSSLKRSESSSLSPARENSELQNIFDSMSFNKARILLTYWDWAVQKSGPYAASH